MKKVLSTAMGPIQPRKLDKLLIIIFIRTRGTMVITHKQACKRLTLTACMARSAQGRLSDRNRPALL